MKNLTVLTLILIASIGASFGQKIKGSDTVLPLVQKFAENYNGSGVTITGGGSGVGIASLLSETCDIAMASRKMKFTEKSKLNKKGTIVTEVIVGYDALAVVIHPDNSIGKLTSQQIEGIYTGVIKNWKELGGDDLKIIPYSRETSSGTYEYFKEELLNRKNYHPEVLSMPATGAVIQSVSQTKGAIGYVGLAYLNDSVKPVEISYDNGANYVSPTVANATNKTYPVVRPLFFYYKKGNNKAADKFIEYTQTPEAQKLVLSVGYIPIK